MSRPVHLAARSGSGRPGPGAGGDLSGHESRVSELCRYVGFGEDDAALLRELGPIIEPRMEAMLDEFYTTIERHSGAAAVFADPERQVPRQRALLADWVRRMLSGPLDLDHAAWTARVGAAHVRHRLPQRYMFAAMAVIRRHLVAAAFEGFAGDPERVRAAVGAIDGALDIELALMLEAYRDDLLVRMKQHERLATIGELAAGIHNELKDPLAAVGAASFALLDRRAVRADPQARRLVASIRSSGERAVAIITDLASYARLSPPRRVPTSTNGLVERAVDLVHVPSTCRLSLDLDPDPPPAVLDPGQARQVLVDVIQNSVDACRAQGEIQLVTRRGPAGPYILVRDSGVGMTPDELERAFEPLFTTKPERVGLGLALARHLAEANGVGLSIDSEKGRGTTVRLDLPGR